MSPSENTPKKKLVFLNNFRYFSGRQDLRPHFVGFGKAPLLLFPYAGRSPPLRHKESGRRFCFLNPSL